MLVGAVTAVIVSPTCTDPLIPIPPVTTTVPDEVLVLAVLPVNLFTAPPTFNCPTIPVPPDIFNAPVAVVVLSVVSVILIRNAVRVFVAVINVKLLLPAKIPALLNCICVLLPPTCEVPPAPPPADHDKIPVPDVVNTCPGSPSDCGKT